MDNLNITTYRYYTVDDIAECNYEITDDMGCQVPSYCYSVYLLSSDPNVSDTATSIICALNNVNHKYVCSTERTLNGDKSAIFHFYDTGSCGYFIDTVAIFSEFYDGNDEKCSYIKCIDDSGNFDLQGTLTNYYNTALSIGRLSVPMALSSSNNWDLDLQVLLSTNSNDNNKASINSIYCNHATCTIFEGHELSNNTDESSSPSYIDTYGYLNKYDNVYLIDLLSNNLYVNFNESQLTSTICFNKNWCDSYSNNDSKSMVQCGYPLTNNTYICISDDICDLSSIRLGVSQDHGIYAYYYDINGKLHINFNESSGLTPITLSSVNLNNSPFVDDVYLTLNSKVERFYGNMQKNLSDCKYNICIDRGNSTDTIYNIYMNYMDIKYCSNYYYECTGILYEGDISDKDVLLTYGIREMITFNDPNQEDKLYPANSDCINFNNIVSGYLTSPTLNYSTSIECGNLPNLPNLPSVYVCNGIKLALLTLKDTFNNYVSCLKSNVNWKMYDNAVVSYCCTYDTSDIKSSGYNYINVLKYSAQQNNVVYRVALPYNYTYTISSGNLDSNGDMIKAKVTISYSNLRIDYSSNILTIDACYSYKVDDSDTQCTPYRIIYDTNNKSNYMDYYTLIDSEGDFVNRTFYLYNRLYNMYIDSVIGCTYSIHITDGGVLNE